MKIKKEYLVYSGEDCLLINDRYLICLDNGVVYDEVKRKDIPQYVFKIRDAEMKKRMKNK